MNAVSAIILVGGPGNSQLRSIVGMPVCMLPVPGYPSLIAAWLDLISKIDVVSNTSILTGNEEDSAMINRAAAEWRSEHIGAVSSLPDRDEHRGTAGTLRDFLGEYPSQNDLLVIEGTTTPPETPQVLFDPNFEHEEVAGVLGSTSVSEPAGMVLLKRKVIDLVPEIGFFDLKEQLLPRILERSDTILVRTITNKSIRLSSARNYLEGIQELGKRLTPDRPAGPWIHEDATVHPEATLGENVLIAKGAIVDPGAVLEDAILLPDAHVGTEALVIRSIVRTGARVPPGTRLISSEEYVLDARTRKSRGAEHNQHQAVRP
jgi:NDP-sugar pyrophosphorylase family protein